MRRRRFIAGLASAAAWPLVARAQESRAVAIGLLSGVSFAGPYAAPVTVIRQGLQEAGFVEGRNLEIEYRSADGRYEQLPELVTDLARARVKVIIAIGVSISELAAKTAGSPVPIVFAMGSDAAEVGVVNGQNGLQAGVTGPSTVAG